jgi:hypothetical protein
MSALERNVSLTEIVRFATAAAGSGALTTCPYRRGSAAAWCLVHAYSGTLAASILKRQCERKNYV